MQAEIKEKLTAGHHEKDKQKLRDYMAKLRAETPIWTIYDDQSHADASTVGQQTPAPGAGKKGTASTSLRPTTPSGDKSAPANPYLR